jgi:hypothetical protein
MRKLGAVGLTVLMAAACTGGGSESAAPSGGSANTSGTTMVQPGEPPVLVGGERTCPVPAPIPARGGFFYPPFYPQDEIPPAERCFASLPQAGEAGLRKAPPPPGDRVVGGVYLVQASSALGAICRRAAAALGFAVACPDLVPAPPTAIQRVSEARGELLMEERFAASVGYIGAGTAGAGATATSVGHLWIDSTAERMGAPSICGQLQSVPSSPTSVRGWPARFVKCPEGSSTHSGHVVLFWREANSWHLVSLHGHTAVNRRMDVLIARSARIVRP